MNMDASRDERALARVEAGETDVTEGGVRWFIVEVTGNPAPVVESVIKWQCDVHAVTAGTACCPNGNNLGAYKPTERVCCARCEEYIAETGFVGGREFGRTSANGAVCMPCVIETELANSTLTETQTALLAFLACPSPETSRRCRRATNLSYRKLEELGFAVPVELGQHAATIMGRRYLQMRVRELPLTSPSAQAAHLVQLAAPDPSAAEETVAHELADAIERRDRRAADYHRATLDEIAKLKRIVIALGGHW